MKQVIVMGGGVAGMTVAHELIERGYAVSVHESRPAIPGGKARTEIVKGSGTDGRKDLMGEHGFRFFPGFYRHLRNTLKRIPFEGNDDGCFGNLVTTEASVISPVGSPWFKSSVHLPTSLDELHMAFELPAELEKLGLTHDDLRFFMMKLLQMLTSCKRRRIEEYGRIGWWHYLDAGNRSPMFQKYLAIGATRNAVATKATLANARTIGDVLAALLLVSSTPGNSADRVLTLPTNQGWLDPWYDHLLGKGVSWHFDSHITGLDFGNGKITGVQVKRNGKTVTETADHYVSALPVEVLAGLLANQQAITDFEPVLRGIYRLKDQVEWMSGIQYYLQESLDMVHGHWNCLGTPWAVTCISEVPFWKSLSMAEYGDGTIGSVLSVDISDWQAGGMKDGPARGKKAADCTADEIARETWYQLRMSMNTRSEILPETYHSYWLDDDIRPGRDGYHQEINIEPLLVNLVGSWDLRPESFSSISNFFIAGDFARTNTDFASMEGANESGRRAANALLHHDGYTGEAGQCKIFDPYDHTLFRPFCALDERRYVRGMPWQSPFDFRKALARDGSAIAHEVKHAVEGVTHFINPLHWLDRAAHKVESAFGDFTGSAEAKAVIRRNRQLGKKIQTRPYAVLQHWEDLSFLHYRVDRELIRPFVHKDLEIDEWDGSAWMTIVPMHMVGLKLHYVGGIPGESTFPELNLRTYVNYKGRFHGVWFLRIDATKRLADWAARTLFHLPYMPANVVFDKHPDGTIFFSDHCRLDGPQNAAFVAEFAPKGEGHTLEPGSWSHWIAERYCSFTKGSHGKLVRGDVIHDPWVFRDVDMTCHVNNLWPTLGIDVGDRSPDKIQYSPGVTSVLWTMVDADDESGFA